MRNCIPANAWEEEHKVRMTNWSTWSWPLLKQTQVIPNLPFLIEYSRFFQFSISFDKKKHWQIFRKLCTNLTKIQAEDDPEFARICKEILKRQKDIAKIDTTTRRSPGKKKQLTTELQSLQDQHEEMVRSQKKYLNIATFRASMVNKVSALHLFVLSNLVFIPL